MALSDIAAGLEVTTEQRDRGVATVDDTTAPLCDRLAPVSADLPCSAERAATLVEHYAAGNSVGAAGRAAGLPAVQAAKTLYLLGEPVCPLSGPLREPLRDWLSGRISRAEALSLTGASEREFALATYVETHDPLLDARAAVEGVLTDADATGEKRAALGDAVEPTDALR